MIPTVRFLSQMYSYQKLTCLSLTCSGYSVRSRFAVVQLVRQFSLLHSRLLLAHQPGRSTHVKPRTGMATNDGLRNVAIEWSLLQAME
jgi:hypothetical protein